MSIATMAVVIREKKASWYTTGWTILLGTSFGNILVEALKLAYP